jgi:hypothetical protein
MHDPEAKCAVERAGDLRDNQSILQCFGHRAAYMVTRALYLRDVEHRSWNSLLVEFYRMSVGISEVKYGIANAQHIASSFSSKASCLHSNET